jgi:hypothetical protein
LFWISFLIFYFSYLFSVLFLAFFVIIIILVYISRLFYVKYLVILVYIRGVVVFILYISCICWFISEKFSKIFLLLGFFIIYLYDLGLYRKFSDIGEFFWIYLFFRFLFNSLVIGYSLNLFKVSGSLRF